MADIVQSKSFNSLFRKIGFSVGLENTLENLITITDVFHEKRKLNKGIWTEIVVEKFKRNENSVQHFANFYNSLGLITHINNKIVSTNVLKVLSIFWDEYKDIEIRRKIAKGILLYLIIISDGDIFLSCLKAKFNKLSINEHIIELINKKREFLFIYYKNKIVQEKIKSRIFIDRQINNDGGAGKSKFPNKSFSIKDYNNIVIDESWHKKVPNHRKNWATSLDLFDNDITDLGNKILNNIKFLYKHNQILEDAYTLLPMDIELINNRATTFMKVSIFHRLKMYVIQFFLYM